METQRTPARALRLAAGLFTILPAFVALADEPVPVKVGGPPAELKANGIERRWSFEAKEGQSLVVAVEGLKYTPDGPSNSLLAILKNDGTPFAGTPCRTQPSPQDPGEPPDCKIHLFDMAEGGKYVVSYTPPQGGTVVTGRVLVTEGVSGKIEPGKPVKLPTMKPAQSARYVFEGKAGHKVSVRLSGISTAPKRTLVTVTLQQLAGGRFNSSMASQSDHINMPTAALRADGQFGITIDPGFGALEGATLEIREE